MKNLADWGVTILGDEVYPLHEPGAGGKYVPFSRGNQRGTHFFGTRG